MRTNKPLFTSGLGQSREGFFVVRVFSFTPRTFDPAEPGSTTPCSMTGRISRTRTGVCGGLVTAHSRATGNLTLPPACEYGY